jgi:DNA-binding response OmpR family regulator
MSAPASPPPEIKLLLVDDDAAIRLGCARVLRGAGYELTEACDGEEGLAQAELTKPALILLDLDMPRRNGWQTLEALRERGYTQPVVMMTGSTSIDDKVRGLGSGADDYLCKPCDQRELLARVHAALRRARPAVAPLPVLHFGRTTVDLAVRTATRADQPMVLTRTEYALLELFARHPGRPLAREVLLEKVWGYTNEANTRTVETHIWRLRQKIGDKPGEPRWLKTVPSAGYILVSDPMPIAGGAS